MKKTILRRTAAVVSAAAITLTAVSCGKDSGESNKTADQLLNHSYRSVELKSIPNFSCTNMIYIEGTDQIFAYGADTSNNYKTYGLLYNSDFSEEKKIEFEITTPENGGSNSIITVGKDGAFYGLIDIIDYGDFEMPDYNSPDFDPESVDYDALQEAITATYCIEKYDMDGKRLESIELDLGDFDYANEYISAFRPYDEDSFVIMSGVSGISLIGKDGTLEKNIPLSDIENVSDFCAAADGRFVLAGYTENGVELGMLDIESGNIEKPKLDMKTLGTVSKLKNGDESYDYYFSGASGYYGMKNGKADELINWLSSDISSNSVDGLIKLKNGDYIAAESSYTNNEICTSFVLLTERDEEELKNTKLINVALLDTNNNVRSAIAAYNKQNTGYRFNIIDYSEYVENSNAEYTPLEQLRKDIIDGDYPDMIVSYDKTLLSSMANKDIFVDLYSYLDNDSELKRDDIVPAVLRAGETDGKLLGLADSFAASTFLIKKKFLDHDGWTVDEMMDVYNKMPKDAEFMAYGSRDVMMYYFEYGVCMGHIDFSKGKCDLNNDDVVKMLEFCKNFKPSEEYDAENETMENEEEYEMQYAKDKLLLSNEIWLTDFGNLAYTEQYIFNNEEISYAGIPSGKGNGGTIMCANYFSILKNCEYKDECWNLIKSIYSEKNQDNLYMAPALRSSFEKRCKDAVKPSNSESGGFPGAESAKYEPLTSQEVNRILKYIDGIEFVMGEVPVDVENIINEEAEAFFNDEKSAAEAVEMMQNRISILVSEQS